MTSIQCISRNVQTEKLSLTVLIGRHNIYNILASASVLYSMGYDLEHIKIGIENLRQVPGRLEEISLCQDFKVFVDYAHTDDALRNVLTALRVLTKGKLTVLFGCGGDRDRGKRPKMGKVATEIADLAFLTSDNPRSEDPEEITKDILAGVENHSKCVVELNRRQAIRLAIMGASSGDTILIAGKGHETCQYFKDYVVPFDDRVSAYESLKERILKRMKYDVLK